MSAVKQAVKLSPTLNWYVTKTKIDLPNGTFIEAIPCDPSGQAGANPGLTVWSEMWGFRHEQKNRLWSEMTVPPTRFGRAFRWVESYAGYTDESTVLQRLYELGTEQSKPHPDFPDLPVTINDAAKLFCYWDHVPRMPWQTPDYYAAESTIMTPNEFRRIHQNEWVTSIDKAFDISWWDACKVGRFPRLTEREPLILALDASISHDSCAAVLLSKHPKNQRMVRIRKVKVWKPPLGGKIDLTDTLEKYVRECWATYNVLEVVYDEYQLHKMCTDLRKEIGVRVKAFSQTSEREIADKQFFEMVLQRQVEHTGIEIMRQHIDNAAVKKTGRGMRFIKPDTKLDQHGMTIRPIDALVAASMGTARCMHLLM